MESPDKAAEGSNSPVYRWYVLFLLCLVYAFNFVDRQILVVLAPTLKTALGIGDAEIGLLYGTTFAVFYSVFGIPLARLADGASRKLTLVGGLCFWSIFTSISGFAGNFTQLGLARLGVGVGEASASPASVSLLADYFPPKRRGTAFAIYTVGMYAGMGASLMIGGAVLAAWPGWFGLEGWRAAFLLVGCPGFVLAALVLLTIREPVRGALDGMPHPGSPEPLKDVLREVRAMIAPWVGQTDATRKMLRRAMLRTLVVVSVGGLVLTLATEFWSTRAAPSVFDFGGITVSVSAVQWAIIGFGFYVSTGWLLSIRQRDPTAFALTAGSTAYRNAAIACALLAAVMYGTGAFAYLYGTRYLGFGPQDALPLGALSTASGVAGTLIGGIAGDMAKLRHSGGRIMLAMGAVVGSTLAAILAFTTDDRNTFFFAYGTSLLLLTIWPPVMIATAQELVIPRLRGLGLAVQTLATSLVGLGVGPYLIGLLSDTTGSLRIAILCSLLLVPPALFFMLRVVYAMSGDEAKLRQA